MHNISWYMTGLKVEVEYGTEWWQMLCFSTLTVQVYFMVFWGPVRYFSVMKSPHDNYYLRVDGKKHFVSCKPEYQTSGWTGELQHHRQVTSITASVILVFFSEDIFQYKITYTVYWDSLLVNRVQSARIYNYLYILTEMRSTYSFTMIWRKTA